ncbi:MAG: protein kinase [Candidatus Sulfopaludibacter sp.]|nr:protein kinase [Candidatus Sulfopaludibacter sp.]
MADGGVESGEGFSAGDWELIKDLVFTCQSSPPPDVGQWLDEQRTSEKVRLEVTRLLQASSDCGSFMGQSATEKYLGVRMHQPLRIGRYRVMDQIGSGGSGVVYAAWDESLNRKVAVKVLRPEVAQNAELQKRLRWDARAASALQHPNIIVVHEIGSDKGVDYVAMECISGSTLSERIRAGGMENREVLNLAIQICNGLEAAHAAGIVHRDLKPGNIMITDQGVVKILDFGLAKNCAGGIESDAPETVEGRFAGTVAYVSPEQADAKPVDARSDIFSFGSVLYEMLTGRQAFPGGSTVSVLADILLSNPQPPHQVVPRVASGFDDIVNRCLRKDRERRFQSIAEVRVRLRELEDQTLHPESQNTIMLPVRPPQRRNIPALAALGLAIAVLATAVTYVAMRAEPPADRNFSLTRVTADRGVTGFPALSRDGTLLAYASDRAGQGNLDIWIQRSDSNEPQQLTTNPANDYEPVFSPDGARLVFRSDRDGGGLYTVSCLGGSERPLVAGGRGAQFSPDGKWIAYWTGEPGASFQPGCAKVFVISSLGGVPEQFQPGFQAAAFPIWSPGGDRILFYGRASGSAGAKAEWWTAPFPNGAAAATGLTKYWTKFHLNNPPSFEQLTPSAWLPDQSLIFAAGHVDSTNIWTTKVARDGTPEGEPWRLTAGTANEWHPTVAQSNGHIMLAYEAMSADSDIWAVSLDDRGHPAGQPHLFLTGYAGMGSSSLSSDGSRLVFSSKQPVQNPGRESIRMSNLNTGQHSVIASILSHTVTRPVLSGDGNTVAYWQDKAGYTIPASGGAAQRICGHCGPPTHVSYDGRAVLFESVSDPEQILYAAAGKAPKPLVPLDPPRFTMQSGARFSPDNRWIVFSTGSPGESARQIFIAPLHPDTPVAPQELIALTDGQSRDVEPYWSTDGATIFFLSRRDGFRCIWGRSLDGDKRPRGPVFEVAHFHQTGHALGGADRYPGNIGLSAAPHLLVFSMTSSTSDVWLKSAAAPKP